MASASPMASIAVVEAVGARPNGQASSRTLASITTSLDWASVERVFPVMDTRGIASLLMVSSRRRISSVSPA